jgi:hypothetical protein
VSPPGSTARTRSIAVHRAIILRARPRAQARDVRRRRRPQRGGFTVRGGRIVAIDILADPERLARLDLTVLDP